MADHDSLTIDQIAEHFEAIIRLLGEDPSRQGLVKTPHRAAKALYQCTHGYRQDPADVVGDAIFDHEGSRLIVVRDIEFYSFCEHHILPFFGRISIGYIPGGKIIGISKLARLVNHFARRLQVQERLTSQVAEALMKMLPECKGVIVKCEAQHLCMKMRGVEKQDASTTTIDYTGCFEQSPDMRRQFFDALAQ